MFCSHMYRALLGSNFSTLVIGVIVSLTLINLGSDYSTPGIAVTVPYLAGCSFRPILCATKDRAWLWSSALCGTVVRVHLVPSIWFKLLQVLVSQVTSTILHRFTIDPSISQMPLSEEGSGFLIEWYAPIYLKVHTIRGSMFQNIYYLCQPFSLWFPVGCQQQTHLSDNDSPKTAYVDKRSI